MILADALIRKLESFGVKYIFGVPGDIQTIFLNRLEKSKIKFITMKNEKSATFAADIYSRVSRKVGVCFSTVGPGMTNLVSGLANANMDRSSVIAISDQVKSDDMTKETHQYIESSELLSDITKMNLTLMNPKSINRFMDIAYKVVMKEPKGVHHIAIPADLYSRKI